MKRPNGKSLQSDGGVVVFTFFSFFLEKSSVYSWVLKMEFKEKRKRKKKKKQVSTAEKD